jgi:hypothetical protein
VASVARKGGPKAAPAAAGRPGILLAMTVVLASAGVGYTASRIWPLSSLSGTGGQVPASERRASASWPAQPATAAPAPLPTLALLPPSPAPLPEAVAPAEPPRASSDAAAGTQGAGREERSKQEPAKETGKQEARPASPGPPRANRPVRPQRAAQPAPAPVEPGTKNGYLQDKAMRDFMSYPTYGY